MDPDPAQRVLSGLATAPYRHEVTLRAQRPPEQVGVHLPASVAQLETCDPPAGRGHPAEDWLRVDLRAERLGWLPPVLAAIDRPFVVERPAELRDLVTALADRLTSSARRA